MSLFSMFKTVLKIFNTVLNIIILVVRISSLYKSKYKIFVKMNLSTMPIFIYQIKHFLSISGYFFS